MIKTYTGSSFTLGTSDTELASYLPTLGNSTTLTLKETAAPDGYEPSTAEHQIVITVAESEELKDGLFITTTTYTMTIDGKDAITEVNEKKTDTDVVHDKVTVNKVDQDNRPLAAEEFTLYKEDQTTVLTTYTGQTFEIKTDDSALASVLPEPGSNVRLYLKETKAPEGYEAASDTFPVVIAATEKEELKDGVYVTTTSYTITINGAERPPSPTKRRPEQPVSIIG